MQKKTILDISIALTLDLYNAFFITQQDLNKEKCHGILYKDGKIEVFSCVVVVVGGGGE